MDNKKSYYAVIPANVRYDKELTPNAKLLYGEITALCNEKGYCWATNEYFAELYGVSKKSISKWIKDLIDKKYIQSELIYKEGSKEILHRYIRIVPYPMEEKFHTPMEEKVKDNNTYINNTYNIKESKKETEKTFNEIIDEYTDNEELRYELREYLKTRKSKKVPMTNRALQLGLKQLDKLTDNPKVKIEIVRQTILKGWTTFYELKDKQLESELKKDNSIFDEFYN